MNIFYIDKFSLEALVRLILNLQEPSQIIFQVLHEKIKNFLQICGIFMKEYGTDLPERKYRDFFNQISLELKILIDDKELLRSNQVYRQEKLSEFYIKLSNFNSLAMDFESKEKSQHSS